MTAPPMVGDDAPMWERLRGDGARPPEVGGKGAWLDRLVAAGFRVPTTAVLTTAAYRAVAAMPTLAPLLDQLASEPPPPPEEHPAARQQVDDAFLSATLPAEVEGALRDAATAARGGLPRALLVARSSATAEDLHGTSFAGQYRSFLELDDDAAVTRAVRLVWASLWHPAPRTYRRFHGLDETGLGMAVVLMRQVPARQAGVAFTVDPAGTPDVVRVESVDGLGEQLVSGAVTPTAVLVPRMPGPDATIDPLAREVADLALQVEASLGEPQDLEWAADEDGLWLLQARPITTGGPLRGDGFDTPGAEARRWTTAGIAEMVPGVQPPLRWAVLQLLLDEALRAHDADLGVLPNDLDADSLIGRVRGRVALDAGRVDELRRAVSGEGRSRLDRLRMSRRAARARRQALWEAGTVGVAARELIDLAPDAVDLDDATLLAQRRRLVDLGVRAMTAEVAVAAAAASAVDALHRSLTDHLGEVEASRWVARVTARPGGTVAGWPAAALTEALTSAPLGAAAELAAASSWADAQALVAGAEGGGDLLEALRDVLRHSGSAAVFSGPTWEEQPDVLWPALRAIAERVAAGLSTTPHDPAAPTPLDDLLDGLASNPSWRQTRLLTAQVVDVRRALLRRRAEAASDLLERRERTKGAVLAIGGEVRRVELELGRRLARSGVLERAEDVELLDEQELADAAAGRRAGAEPTASELARRRRWLERCEDAGPLEGAPVAVAVEGSRLEGWGASPGRTTGPARVVHAVEQGGLERGDVLVARTTDASWAPLFMTASAVVVEEGGPLSHAAIVARELGIPAVVNLPGVVASLEGTECRVTVDGDRGEVLIHDDAAARRDADPDLDPSAALP